MCGGSQWSRKHSARMPCCTCLYGSVAWQTYGLGATLEDEESSARGSESPASGDRSANERGSRERCANANRRIRRLGVLRLISTRSNPFHGCNRKLRGSAKGSEPQTPVEPNRRPTYTSPDVRRLTAGRAGESRKTSSSLGTKPCLRKSVHSKIKTWPILRGARNAASIDCSTSSRSFAVMPHQTSQLPLACHYGMILTRSNARCCYRAFLATLKGWPHYENYLAKSCVQFAQNEA